MAQKKKKSCGPDSIKAQSLWAFSINPTKAGVGSPWSKIFAGSRCQTQLSGLLHQLRTSEGKLSAGARLQPSPTMQLSGR